ncbi:MAG: Na(+)-translocating NADH-quinone reductase subunit C [Thermoguttaceae bacterium]|nr:Na(+)-translocating NADH-quinone reductase subunit C [Thermoguttaceae bacterium]
MAKESISRTFAVAAGLCVVCALIVAIASVSLKGAQERNKALDKQVNILRAAGLLQPTEKVDASRAAELFENCKTVVVDLESGTIDESADPAEIEKDPNNKIKLDKADDIASIKEIPAKTVVYLFYDETGELKTVVLPIVGSGLWSVLYGFFSLDGDLNSTANIVFYDHGETPGLGGEISNPVWTAKWKGKKAFNQNGEPALRVIKGTADPASSDIDGISGATLTGKGVTNTVTFWLGEKGFGPFLKNLRAQNGSKSEN